MPKILAHRGNIFGPNPAYENNPDYILHTLSLEQNFYVEADLWITKDDTDKEKWHFALGHDRPRYTVSRDFILNTHRILYHLKSIDTLSRVFGVIMNDIPWSFIQEQDDAVFTSNQLVVLHNDKRYMFSMQDNKQHIIVVHLDNGGKDFLRYAGAYGICTDYAWECDQQYQKLAA